MKVIFFVVLSFFVFLPSVFAQEELKIDPITPTPVPEVEYALPYPGILPDNPLYSLKASRDRIISFFIADPVKKSEFDLLQADKRLQAGVFLLHKHHPDVDLAITTISKGQNYLEEAITVITKIEKEALQKQKKSPTGTPDASVVGDVPEKLYTASQKHHQVLEKEYKTIPPDQQKEFMLLLTRSKQLINRAGAVRSQ